MPQNCCMKEQTLTVKTERVCLFIGSAPEERRGPNLKLSCMVAVPNGYKIFKIP